LHDGNGALEAGLDRDEDRALARSVGLLAVLDHVHAEGLLVFAGPQRHQESDQPQQDEYGRERVSGTGEGCHGLPSKLACVAVEQAIRGPVPRQVEREPHDKRARRRQQRVREGQHAGVEIFAGLLVAFAPRIGAFVVAGWLAGIVVNLLTNDAPRYYDIALRDFGLMLAALTLGRLALAVVTARKRLRS
jgi:hypothetical protein